MADQLNPWLRPVVFYGRDEYGQPKTETAPHLKPELYFWLGKDADPPVPMVTSITCSPSPNYSWCAYDRIYCY
jgi:hypothetical protein